MNLSVSIIFLISGWCEAVIRTGYIGEKSNIYCYYQPQYSGDHKKLCKTTENKCFVMVSTNTAIVAQDRFFIYDDKRNNAVIIIISRVSDSDSGQYKCITETGNGRSIIFDTVEFWTIPLTGYIGGEAQMTDLYAAAYERHGKYLQRAGVSTSLIQTEHSQIRADNEKFSIYDNNRAREVTVTFKRLEAEDSGRYICGIKDVGPYNEWSLAVRSLISVSEFERHTVKISCKYQSPRSGKKRKHFCRGRDPGKCLEQGALGEDRVTIEDRAVEEVFMVKIPNFMAEDAGVYWCVEFGVSAPEFTWAIQLAVKRVPFDSEGNVLDTPLKSSESSWATWILVLVVVVLLGVCLLLMLLKYKRTSAQSLPDHLMSTKTTGNTQITEDCMYDDVQTSGQTQAKPPTSPRSNRPNYVAEYQNCNKVTNNRPYLAVLPMPCEKNPANHSLDNTTGVRFVTASHTVNSHLNTSLQASVYEQLDANTNQGDSGYSSILI